MLSKESRFASSIRRGILAACLEKALSDFETTYHK